MSARQKLRGGSDSELTRFKALWRESLAESAKDSLRSLFLSQQTQAQIRAYIREAHGVNLKYDNQLNAFRDWEIEQRALDLEAERAGEDERRLEAEHPDWTKDQVREDLLRRSYLRARAQGDFKLGLKTVAADAKLEALELDRDKFKIESDEFIASILKRAAELNESEITQAEKIATMRREYFKDVEALRGKLQIPK